MDNKSEELVALTKERLEVFVKTHEGNMKKLMEDPTNKAITDFSSSMDTVASDNKPKAKKKKKSVLKDLDVNRKTPGLLQSVPILISRELINMKRVPSNLSARLFNLCSMAFLMFIFIWKIEDDQAGVQNRIGVIYETVAGCAFVGFLNSLALCKITCFSLLISQTLLPKTCTE